MTTYYVRAHELHTKTGNCDCAVPCTEVVKVEDQPKLDHYLLRVALQSVAFHIAMSGGNVDNPFQHEREKALEYLRTLAPDPRPAAATGGN
jgi:hypothetical protein